MIQIKIVNIFQKSQQKFRDFQKKYKVQSKKLIILPLLDFHYNRDSQPRYYLKQKINFNSQPIQILIQ